MRQLLDKFDPTAAANGVIPLALTGGGTVIMRNLSPIELQLTFSDGDQELLEAWTGRRFDFAQPATSVAWQQYAVPSGQTSSPLSLVTGIQYDPKAAKCIKETYPVAYHRLANTGNPTSGGGVGVATSVSNDGNAPATVFLEGTETGSTSSNVSIDNSAQALLRLLSAGAYANVLQSIKGTATAKAQLILRLLAVIGAASFDGGLLTTDGAGNVTGVSFTGALFGNATSASGVAASGVTGTLPASQVGTGYPGSNVSGIVGAASLIQTNYNGTKQNSQVWEGGNTPATPTEGDVWFDIEPAPSSTFYGPTGTPTYGWNKYTSGSGLQCWVEWDVPVNGVIDEIKVFGAGDGGGTVHVRGVVWTTGGVVVGYDSGSGVGTTGGSGSAGGQSWSAASSLGAAAMVNAGTTYKIGVYLDNLSVPFDWSVYSSVQSPFTGGVWGYASPATAGANEPLGSGFTPGANLPITIQARLTVNGVSHIYVYHGSAWQKVV